MIPKSLELKGHCSDRGWDVCMCGFFFFYMKSYYVAQTGLKLMMILLPYYSTFWDYKCDAAQIGHVL